VSQATAVFSALGAYDTNLGQRQADWLENPQIKKIPFHLVDESFLRQQSLVDVLQGSRAIDRLLSIASPEEIKNLQPISQLFHQIISDKSYLQSQSLDDLRSAKDFLVEQKMHAFEVAYYLEKKPSNESMKAIDSMISKINDVAAEKIASPKMSFPARGQELINGAVAARSDLPPPRGMKQSRSQRLASQAERRMAFAPYLAAMMGLELKKDTSRLQRAARFAPSSAFTMAVMGNSDYVLGIPLSVKGRLSWAQEHAKSRNSHIEPGMIESIAKGAESLKSEGFKIFVEALMTKNSE
jgi:hypothetical protein